MKMTVRNVAKMAGVSPASVSRVMNGLGGVGDETRKRILKVISDTDYYPRKKAVTGGNIAVIMPQSTLYYKHFFLNLQQMLKIFGQKWNLLMLPHDLSCNEFRRKCMREKIEGVMIFGFSLHSSELETAISQMPHVWLNSHHFGAGTSNVLIGNEFAGKLAGRYLISKGCKKCAVIEFPSKNPGFQARCSGFRFECFSQKVEFNDLKFGTSLLEMSKYSELEAIFSEAAERGVFKGFDGIFIPESSLLQSLHSVLQRSLDTLPLLVCGNNSPEHLAGVYPRPATVDLGGELLIELACQELFTLISGKKNVPERSSFFISPKLCLP